MYGRIHPLVWTAGSFAIVFAVWEFLVRLFAMPQYLLPGPGPVFVSLAENLPTIMNQTLWTATTVLVGFLILEALMHLMQSSSKRKWSMSFSTLFGMSKVLLD